MDIRKIFGTDASREEAGVWRDIGGGVRLRVARSGNRNYGRMLTRLADQHQRVLDLKNEEADALSDELMVEVLSKTVLLDWDGPLELDGEALPYSAENAAKLLRIKDFRRLVIQLADDVAAYRAASEEQQGNV